MNYVCCCHGHLLGQSFVSNGWRRCLPQDGDNSRSCPHSFPGSCYMSSEMPAEQFRSDPELAGSREGHHEVITRLVRGFSSYSTLQNFSSRLCPQMPQKFDLYSLPVIWEHWSFVADCS